jgi:aspartate aminotransferase-like enzyme
MLEGDIPPITPPVATLAAFRQALREFPGVEQRGKRYAGQTQYLRTALRWRGLRTAIDDEEASCALSTFTLPSGWTYDEWYEVSHRNGYVIYACKGPFRERYFQMSTMGEVKDEHLAGWLETFDQLVGVGERRRATVGVGA